MYDLQNEPFFRIQHVRCKITFHNDMGHLMPRVQWLTDIDSSVRAILEKQAIEIAYKESKDIIVESFEKVSDTDGYVHLYSSKVPKKIVHFKTFNFAVECVIVYKF